MLFLLLLLIVVGRGGVAYYPVPQPERDAAAASPGRHTLAGPTLPKLSPIRLTPPVGFRGGRLCCWRSRRRRAAPKSGPGFSLRCRAG